MKLIGLMGKALSGKDTVGRMLVDADRGGATVAFANKLKEVCMDLFGLSNEDVFTEEGKKRVTDLPCNKCMGCGSIAVDVVSPAQRVCRGCGMIGESAAFDSKWTVRMILQHVGTEGMRRVDQDVWVKHALRRASTMLAAPVSPATFVAITDVRFRSEALAIQAAGGQVWRIRRPQTDHVVLGLGNHPSEAEMDTIPDTACQRVLRNDGTLEHLQAQALEGLEQFLGA